MLSLLLQIFRFHGWSLNTTFITSVNKLLVYWMYLDLQFQNGLFDPNSVFVLYVLPQIVTGHKTQWSPSIWDYHEFQYDNGLLVDKVVLGQVFLPELRFFFVHCHSTNALSFISIYLPSALYSLHTHGIAKLSTPHRHPKENKNRFLCLLPHTVTSLSSWEQVKHKLNLACWGKVERHNEFKKKLKSV
jgi:hypothetical protein